ncbi:GNAT family N-acetyltransferase [Kitasatospora sp. NBC_00240]|uniref:GNAT family N-acetyltransferase n=1 Tax=Kitasatospora sp. NBC_00240 TaxID=2903567 RepID=UPI002257B04A|nr:GNAT family N-acetyltransferase [Kitasatospora sp. NBC_00240]MCX5208038.1 GNAT family N-acetyltransferase [Kitasatospora sp. NBC_00240]
MPAPDALIPDALIPDPPLSGRPAADPPHPQGGSPERPPAGRAGAHPLDNAVRAALLGPHAHLAQRQGEVVRYPPDVSPFIALPDHPDASVWRDVATLLGPGAVALVTGVRGTPPPDWEILMDGAGVQLVDEGIAAAADAEAVPLGYADVPEMLDLVARTQPGPFLPRTVELGTYLGIRRGGRLVAMAGERLHPPGWTEISAVCTDREHRGEGLATRLVHAVAAGIRARGETPFLHAAASNTDAIRLYESLGFRLRRTTTFLAVVVPGAPTG